MITPRSSRSLEWAGYAAAAWAIGYALLVRVYQGLGGTIGLAGTFDDPDGFRRASLTAAACWHRRTGIRAAVGRAAADRDNVGAAVGLAAVSSALVIS
jgi:hypothetical protein